MGACVGTVIRPGERRWKVQTLRPTFYRLFFNVANCILACAAGALLFRTVRDLAPPTGVEAILGLTAFTATYFAVNTLGVSLAIAFQQQLSWIPVWKENFLWTAPGFFRLRFRGCGHPGRIRAPGALGADAPGAALYRLPFLQSF